MKARKGKMRFEQPQFEALASCYGVEVYEPDAAESKWIAAFAVKFENVQLHVYHYKDDRIEIRLSGAGRYERIWFKDYNYTAIRIFTATRRKIRDEVEIAEFLRHLQNGD